jgi:hypothetical protein
MIMKIQTRAALCLLASAALAAAEVTVHPFPEGEKPAEDYEVAVGGQKIVAYQARTLDAPFDKGEYDHGGPYAFASFDLAGSAEVEIRARRGLSNVVIRPLRLKLSPQHVDEHTIRFSVDKPVKLSIEPDGKNGPLLLFVNPPETSAPDTNDENVVFFGPGIHRPEVIRLRENQTLYIAGGAVVKGSVRVEGPNVRIRGRGILDGNDWAWTKGPGHMIQVDRTSNVDIEDIVLRGSWGWTIVPDRSHDVRIRNVKICNGRVQNDDGINPVNSQRILIEDCFIRTDDDCIALKGLHGADSGFVEDIRVRNCTLWCDRARVFLLGHESRAGFMRNVAVEGVDIVHFAMTPFLLEPGEEMYLGNVRFEKIRLEGAGKGSLIRLMPTVNQYMTTRVPGRIENVVFRDVGVVKGGEPGDYTIEVAGKDAAHDVRGVVLDRVTINGRAVMAGWPSLRIGPFTDGVDVRFGM